MAGDLKAYVEFDTKQAEAALIGLERQTAQTTGRIQHEWSKAGDNIAKMFGPGNLLRAAFAGIGASIGIAAAGMREYAKSSEDAAQAMERMTASKNRLFREIGADIFEVGFGLGINPDDLPKAAMRWRDYAGVTWEWLTTPQGDINSGRAAGFNDQVENMKKTREYDAARLERASYLSRYARATMEGESLKSGNDFSSREADARAELRRIALERSEVASDDLLYKEKMRALAAEEITVAERLNQIEKQRREDVERRADAEQKAREQIEKQELAAMMGRERAKDSLEFQKRELMVAFAKAGGDTKTAAKDELNLQFDRMMYSVDSDENYTPDQREGFRAWLTTMRAQRLELLGAGKAVEQAKRFANTGFVRAGFAGVAQITQQAFMPAGSGVNYEVKQTQLLQKIADNTSKAGVAVLN